MAPFLCSWSAFSGHYSSLRQEAGKRTVLTSHVPGKSVMSPDLPEPPKQNSWVLCVSYQFLPNKSPFRDWIHDSFHCSKGWSPQNSRVLSSVSASLLYRLSAWCLCRVLSKTFLFCFLLQFKIRLEFWVNCFMVSKHYYMVSVNGLSIFSVVQVKRWLESSLILSFLLKLTFRRSSWI